LRASPSLKLHWTTAQGKLNENNILILEQLMNADVEIFEKKISVLFFNSILLLGYFHCDYCY